MVSTKMSIIKFQFIFLLTSICHDIVQAQDPFACPFNKNECQCTLPNPPTDPVILDHVVCQSDTFPKFTAQPGVKYFIQNSLKILGQVYDIPANAISIFHSIGSLELDYGTVSTPAISQKWDDHAFDNVSIKGISTDGLIGIFPKPPIALNSLATRSLTKLYVESHYGEISLDKNSFDNFSDLTDLTIRNAQITKIDVDTFMSLAKLLTRFDLSLTSLLIYPAEALNKLTNLRYLSLRGNQFSIFPNQAFQGFKNLGELRLSDNNLTQSIQNGALDALPPTLQSLQINNVGLTEIPQRIIQQTSSYNLFLIKNNIKTIRANDFQFGSNLKMVALANNPISTIENGALWPLTQATSIDLTNTQVTQIDLSIFPNTYDFIGYLDGNNLLKSLTVLDVNKVSWTAKILIRRTGLKVIDKTIDNLLNRKRSVQLDLSNNIHLKCDGLEWLAPYLLQYVQGTLRIKIDGATCADKGNMSLSDYLTPFEPGSSTQSAVSISTSTDIASSSTTSATTSTSTTTANTAGSSSSTSTTMPFSSSTISGTSFRPPTTVLVLSTSTTIPISRSTTIAPVSTSSTATPPESSTKSLSVVISLNPILVIALLISFIILVV